MSDDGAEVDNVGQESNSDMDSDTDTVDDTKDSDDDSIADNLEIPNLIESTLNTHLSQLVGDEFEDDADDGSEIMDDDTDVVDMDTTARLQKLKTSLDMNPLLQYHSECVVCPESEMASMLDVVRTYDGTVVDPFHKTTPILTKYERTRVLGVRSAQLNAGMTPMIEVPSNVIDGSIIAEMELVQKKIPIIICRLLPNGGKEFWRVHELENIG